MGKLNGFHFIETFASVNIAMRFRHFGTRHYVVITEDSHVCTFVRQKSRLTDSYLPQSS